MKLDELYILLVLNNAQANAGFAETAAAGDRMAVQIDTGLKTVQEAMLRVDASVREMAATMKLGATEAEMSMGSLAAKMEADQAKFAAMAGEASAANVKMGQALKGSSAEADAASSKFGLTSGAMKNVALAAVAVGYETAKMAGDFQQVSEKLVTSAGEDQKALEGIIRPGLLTMAGQLGVSTKQLADDLYPVESAGYHGAQALKVLEAAEKGAAAEMADGTHVTDALTSALHDYYPKALSVAEVTQHSNEIMSGFLATTSQGKMSFDQLASSLNNILPTAATLHIKMEDVLGTLASMTSHGISAQQASENLNHAMQKLASGGTTQMKGWAASVGIDLRDIQQNLGERGIAGSLQIMDDAIKKHLGPDAEHVFLQMSEAVSKSTPAVKSLTMELASGSMGYKDYVKAIKALSGAEHENGAEMLSLLNKQNGLGHGIENGVDVMTTYGAMWKNVTGDMTTAKVAMMTAAGSTDYTNESIRKIGDSMKNGQGLTEAWTNVQKNFNQQMKQAEEGAKAFAVAIGMKLLPVLTPIAHAIGVATEWMAKNQTVATALAIVIGGVLTTALLAFAGKGVVALANLSAQFIIDTAKGAVWAATKIAQLFGVQVAVEGEAVAEGVAEERGAARRLAAAVGGGVKWLAVKTAQGVAATVSAVYYAALSYAPWVAAMAKQVASAVVDGARWLAVTIAHGVAAAASAALQAGLTAASWVASTATMLASQLAKGAVWVATMIGQFIAVTASAVIQAAIVAAAWVAANIAMILATGGIILAIGAVILIGYEIIKHWKDIKRVCGEVWDWIKQKFTEVKDWIVKKFEDLKTGAEQKINDFLQNMRDLPGNILRAIGDLGRLLWDAGAKIIGGLWDGLKSKWNDVTRWLGGLGSVIASIKGPASYDATILHYNGQMVMYGFYNGLIGYYNQHIVPWLNSVADSIRNLKGPLDKDRQLLVPHGNAIMAGLHEGLQTRGSEVLAYVSRYATQLQSAMGRASSSGLGVSGGLFGGAPSVNASGGTSWTPPSLEAPNGGGQGVTVHLHVAGSVWTTSDLVKEIQTAMLRHGIRNNNPGINYSYA